MKPIVNISDCSDNWEKGIETLLQHPYADQFPPYFLYCSPSWSLNYTLSCPKPISYFHYEFCLCVVWVEAQLESRWCAVTKYSVHRVCGEVCWGQIFGQLLPGCCDIWAGAPLWEWGLPCCVTLSSPVHNLISWPHHISWCVCNLLWFWIHLHWRFCVWGVFN